MNFFILMVDINYGDDEKNKRNSANSKDYE